MKPRTLQERYKAYKDAQLHDDHQRIAATSGEIDGRRYCRTALGFADDYALAERVRALKRDHQIVDRTLICAAAAELWGEQHPRPLRSVRFVISPQFVTRFRRRHGFNSSRHRLRTSRPQTADKENERLAETAEYHIRVDDALQRYGPALVLNADETPARAVETSGTSLGVRGEPNIVDTAIDPRRGITTTATIAANGALLPLQAVVKGKTQRAINNRQLPADVVADCSASGWQTSKTMVNLIRNVVAPYTDDQYSALLLDDYKAHWTPAVRAAAAEHNIELIPVPKGQTGELQPLDVSINGEVKARARREYVQDKQEGRADADTLGRAVHRINNAYRAVKPAHIASSFKQARHGPLPR